ncbi:MAG TPA: YciI family protein [Thermoanaerobaculia bacterium]|jgi:hypothetical protein
MRFLIMVKGNEVSEAGGKPDEAIFEAMSKYHEELEKAGALLDATGLQPTSKGARVRYSRGKPTWTDGPFPESREIVAGYTLIQADSWQEAMDWAMRFPAPFGQNDGEIEIRELFLYEPEDFV